MHYLSMHRRKSLALGLWDSIPAMFLPSNTLDICFTIVHVYELNDELTNQLSLLYWISSVEVKTHHCKIVELHTQQKKGVGL